MVFFLGGMFGTARESKNVGGRLQGIAEDQAAAVKEVIKRQEADRERGLEIARPKASELLALQRQADVSVSQLKRSEKLIEREEKILASVDPAIQAAGEQATALLEGKEAAALAPFRQQRQRQQAQLEAQLRRQGIDPTSSAGIEALSAFAAQSAGLEAQVQQQALGSLGSFLGQASGVAAQQAGIAQQAGALAGQTAQASAQQEANVAQRRLAAFLGTPVDRSGLVATAGARNVKALVAAQARLGAAQQSTQIGGSIIGGLVGAGSGNVGGKSPSKQAGPEQGGGGSNTPRAL